jgi:hemolysin activation/secretion protein
MKSPVRTYHLTSLPALLVFSISVSSYAAGPGVDAGSLLQQNEQELNLKKSAPPTVQPSPTKPRAKASTDEATIQVNGFTFVGNTLLAEDVLNRALSEFINRQLTLAQLREAADVVVNTYRSAGWTVRAYLPRQEIQNGIVTIQIVEALFGGAQLEGPNPKRMDANRLIKMAEANLVKGKPLHADHIDRTLLLLDDLPGVSVTGNLIAGAQDGETNLALTVADEALFKGNVTADNQGSRVTGPERISVNLSVNSPARRGDALIINALKSQASDYDRLSYSIPLGDYGWRGGLHASTLSYRVITDEFKSLDPHGTASTAGWDISYPLMRSQVQNINFALSYDNKNFDNTSNKVTSSYNIRAYTASLNTNRIDNWAGGGGINAGLNITSGSNSSTDSHYAKINLNLSRLQTLTKDISLYAAISTQHTNANLDSSEKMYLGGISGIRAYPSSEAGGSEGRLATLELRKNLDQNVTLSGFYDYGWIKVNHSNSATSSSSTNNYSLKGYGLSLAWQATPGIDVKFTVAQRIGENPGALSSGSDGDGTKKMTRIWLSTGFAF